MKTLKSMMRIAALTALGCVAAIGIFSAGMSDMAGFVLSKAVGFGAAAVLCKLYLHWKKTDRWLQRYEEFCNAERTTRNAQ